MRREAELWFRMALEDLEDAKRMLEAGRYFRAAFFSQQAVEKALKSLFFVVRREDPPHIHTVTELYLMLRDAGFKLDEDLEEAIKTLNKYYTVTRYPDAANGLPSESVDEFEARRALDIAERVIKEVEQRLGS